jgi:hypothetical protein
MPLFCADVADAGAHQHKKDADGAYFPVWCHGQEYKFRPMVPIEVPESSRGRMMQQVGVSGTPVRELSYVSDADLIANYREGAGLPEADDADDVKVITKRVFVLPGKSVLKRCSVAELRELAEATGTGITPDMNKNDLVVALDESR